MYSVTTGKVDGSSCGLTGAGGVVGSIILVLHEIAVRTNHSRWALEGNATIGLLVSLTTDHGRAVIFSFGSEQFVRQVKSRLAASPSSGHGIPPRQLSRLDRQEVYEAVLKHYGRPPEALSQRGARERCRGVAAYLARRLTGATVRELATDLGLSRPDIVPNLTRRIERDLQETRALAKDIRAIEKALLEEQTTNKA